MYCKCICSALFRNLRFLQKVLCFLGIPKTLALALAIAQVGAAIFTVAHWGTVEMAAPTWARARARARAGPYPECVRAHIKVGAALSRYP